VKLFETLLCGYEIPGELGALGRQGGDEMRFGQPENMGRRLEFSLDRCNMTPHIDEAAA
jgi:hypothetical protein